MTSSARCARWLIAALVGVGCAPFERGERRVAPNADGGLPDAGAADISFEVDVLPVLLDRCGICHREGGSGTASKKYVLTEEPEVDHATVLALVDLEAPGASRLLEKARGEEHVGGAALPEDAADYALVRDWIAAGAPP